MFLCLRTVLFLISFATQYEGHLSESNVASKQRFKQFKQAGFEKKSFNSSRVKSISNSRATTTGRPMRIVQRGHPNGVRFRDRKARREDRAPLIEKIILTRVQSRRTRDTWWKPRGLRPFSVSLSLCRPLLPVPLLLFLLCISGPREKALKPENLIS